MKNLSFITYRDVMTYCDVSASKARKLITQMQAEYHCSDLMASHLFDWLGMAEMGAFSDLLPLCETALDISEIPLLG